MINVSKRYYPFLLYLLWIGIKWLTWIIVENIPEPVTTGPTFRLVPWLLGLSATHVVITVVFVFASILNNKTKETVRYVGIAFAILYTYLLWYLTF